jgi:hypothetical protein
MKYMGMGLGMVLGNVVSHKDHILAHILALGKV